MMFDLDLVLPLAVKHLLVKASAYFVAVCSNKQGANNQCLR